MSPSRLRRLGAAVTALGCLAVPSGALGAEAPVAPPSVPAPTAAQPGSLKLTIQRAGGDPLFAFAGRRVTLRGVVTPFVAGQTVKVSVYREGRKIAVRTMTPVAMGNGAGQFHLSFTSVAGYVQVRAAHYATPLQAAFAARAPAVQFVNAGVGPGSRGASVRLLQAELNALRYAVPLGGTFDEATGRALVAYRKMTGLERTPQAGQRVFELLQRGAGRFHVRYPGDGRHVEANLTKQVLAEIEPGGRVRTIYTMSSGKPSTPTVIGRFRVYMKTPGTNSEGMVDSNYFIRGYAIHGYAEVPTYAASHGCLRVPIPDAPAIYGWVRQGTPVDVYNENGSGSSRVRANAGP